MMPQGLEGQVGSPARHTARPLCDLPAALRALSNTLTSRFLHTEHAHRGHLRLSDFAMRRMARALSSAFGSSPRVAAAAAPALPPAVALAAARLLSGAASVSGGGDAEEASATAAAASSSQKKELYLVFTCGRCETRAVKGFSRQAYEHGTGRETTALHTRCADTHPQALCWWTARVATCGT